MPKSDDPKAPLPASIKEVLPTATSLVAHAVTMSKLLPSLERELKAAKQGGAIKLARAFVTLHRAFKRIDEELKPLSALFERYKTIEVPEALDQEGVTSIPLEEGYRVTINNPWRASIKPDMREKAYDWLRKNGHGDIIIGTVNSSTLAALAKELNEGNVELPTRLFNAQQVPSASVTATK